MTPPSSLLYLSRADVVACGLSAADVADAVQDAFRAKSAGRARTARGLVMPYGAQASFAAKGGWWGDYAAVKWYGYFAGNARLGQPDFRPMIIVNETAGGLPVAVMDGTWISEVRTAAITAVAARRLADPEARSVGFVACGAQARAHVDALRAVTRIDVVRAYSRRPETAAAFAESLRAAGCDARAVARPEDAVRDLDIVVTSVPHMSLTEGFLDAAWTAPGAFVSMVDLGFSWRRDTMAAFDAVVTDDLDQDRGATGLNYDGPFEADLGGIVAAPPAPWHRERRAMIFAGSGLADIAVAGRILERARQRGIGTSLAP